MRSRIVVAGLCLLLSLGGLRAATRASAHAAASDDGQHQPGRRARRGPGTDGARAAVSPHRAWSCGPSPSSGGWRFRRCSSSRASPRAFAPGPRHSAGSGSSSSACTSRSSASSRFVIDLPLAYYQGFVRQHAYGLSNQTLGKWISDSLTGLAVGIVDRGAVPVGALPAAEAKPAPVVALHRPADDPVPGPDDPGAAGLDRSAVQRRSGR